MSNSHFTVIFEDGSSKKVTLLILQDWHTRAYLETCIQEYLRSKSSAAAAKKIAEIKCSDEFHSGRR
jgi:hypothetical protein